MSVKFICEECDCDAPCVLTIKDDRLDRPDLCPYASGQVPEWRTPEETRAYWKEVFRKEKEEMI